MRVHGAGAMANGPLVVEPVVPIACMVQVFAGMAW